jgi:hypothetical protein
MNKYSKKYKKELSRMLKNASRIPGFKLVFQPMYRVPSGKRFLNSVGTARYEFWDWFACPSQLENVFMEALLEEFENE